MVYSQARLEDVLRIIKADNIRLCQEKQERYARTHYRDDFQLRKCSKVSAAPVLFYLDFESDLDDDDYDPNERQPNDKNTWGYRHPGRGGQEVHDTRRKKRVCRQESKPQKGEHEPLPPGGPASSFVTLKFQQPESKICMRDLSLQHGTEVNVWLKEQSPGEQNLWARSGGSFKRLSSPEEMRQLVKELADKRSSLSSRNRSTSLVDARSAAPRRLRNGKVRAAVTKRQKRRKKHGTRQQEEPDSLPERTGNRRKQEAAYRPISIGSQKSYEDLAGPGCSAADAISIDEDSDEDQERDRCGRNDKRVVSEYKNRTTARTSNNEAIIDLTDLQDDDHHNNDEAEITTIETCFAHPINFKSTHRPCDFCSDYRFGIVGHRIQRVTVARTPSGVITELGSGHAETYAPTQMCMSCALDRMMITRCIIHHFQRIHEPFSNLDIHTYASDLIRKDPQRCLTRPPAPVQRICSICPMPATFTCHSLQKTDRLLNPVQNPALSTQAQQLTFQNHMQNRRKRGLPCDFELKPPLYGCGLALCEKCKVVVDACEGRLIQREILAATAARGEARRWPEEIWNSSFETAICGNAITAIDDSRPNTASERFT